MFWCCAMPSTASDHPDESEESTESSEETGQQQQQQPGPLEGKTPQEARPSPRSAKSPRSPLGGLLGLCQEEPEDSAESSEENGQPAPEPPAAPLGGQPTREQQRQLEPLESEALPKVKSFDVKLHSAQLSRSFAKIGWMDPYAIVVLGDSREEAGRTPAAKHAHKKPVWDTELHLNASHVPDSITIAVWDKNHFHRDVFCGSTTVPCAPDMGTLQRKTFTLTKKDKPTGHITCTISVQVEAPARGTDHAAVKPTQSLGPELDVLASWTDASGDAHGTSISFRQGEHWAAQGCRAHGETPAAEEEDEDEKHEEEGVDVPAPTRVPTATGVEGVDVPASTRVPSATGVEGASVPAPTGVPSAVGVEGADVPASTRVPTATGVEGADVPAPTRVPSATGVPCAPLVGKWKCVDTWGLDEFLKAQKRSFFERKTAGAAKWPDWEFKLSGDKVVFLNFTMIGLLEEEITLGKEYESVDGKKNVWKVTATWTPAGASGGSLVQDRRGEKAEFGKTREERTVTGDKLEFKLTKDGTSWGRSFVRA